MKRMILYGSVTAGDYGKALQRAMPDYGNKMTKRMHTEDSHQ